MSAHFNVPKPFNEPVLGYAPGSPERAALKNALNQLKSAQADIPMYIGGKEIRTGDRHVMRPPHELAHSLGHFHKGNSAHVQAAIDAALSAKTEWENTPWEQRAAIFLKAADLLAGPYRARMNAATMLAQSKNAFQAEIDAACEMADFFRFNVYYMTQIQAVQPDSMPGMWNRLEYRPLEGFVLAVTPFNFTSIAANLPTAPALLGNTVVWKPAETQIFSAQVIMDLLTEAGLPPGVVNLVYADGPVVGDLALSHADFAGLHFTGSTATFQHLWRTIGANVSNYRSYPRVVGETGGKDFVFVHPSADVLAVITALSRGAFEYQGQKCSAASRAYIPKSLWKTVKEGLQADIESMRMGSPEDFRNFINAVIDERAFDKITGYLHRAKQDPNVELVAGGGYDKKEGFFIEPTVLRVDDPRYITMCEELFGPVLTVFVYEDDKVDETLAILDTSSPYALTGAVFAQDRYALEHISQKLRHSAGNFYLNDKPTGAVVGQQPFGGARASGTNDKAGSVLNLYRWLSPRTIKETFNPPKNYRYPFMDAE
jgi:1-pyrroline-5-carboxylate dehydrogenase